MTPQAYSKCIAGTQVGMVTGQVPVREYGVVACHVPNGSACDASACPPFVPNMELARHRLEHGYASTLFLAYLGPSPQRVITPFATVCLGAYMELALLSGLLLLASPTRGRSPFASSVQSSVCVACHL